MIRRGRTTDIDQLLAMSLALHKESEVTRKISLNLGKLQALLRAATEPSDDSVICLYVYEMDGLIRGAVLGVEQEYYFSSERYATDLVLYVDEESRKGLLGGLIARRLWGRYRDWAKSRGLNELRNGVSTGIEIEGAHRFFVSVGMQHIGGFYSLPLKER